MSQKPLGEIDHKEGKANGIGDRRLFDIHEILQAPELFGISEIELDLESELVVVNELVISKVQITAEEDDMGPFLRREIGLDDDDHVQRVGKRLVEHWGLDRHRFGCHPGSQSAPGI